MRKCVVLIVLFLLLAGVSITGCNQGKIEEVTFEKLFSNPSRYSGKEITIEGFYFQGFESNILCETLVTAASGHLSPQGKGIWVEDGLPLEVYEKLNQQQQMGPLERYGKVRMTGVFKYGGKYGHLGGYDCQIIPTGVQRLPQDK